ncbi:hypothetical protein [Prochlorococcus marinus]|uniref:hypothetical protein n=1 Tax=Prochlorococcus marinus TaxID=1219 RepID=UPI0007B38974|nr:hypothetical protein [Prochlorococcus marinus]KZR73700.1 hypothetical protein PMIT1320_02295 [Prochlorococcus marinus str. MIT 1320]
MTYKTMSTKEKTEKIKIIGGSVYGVLLAIALKNIDNQINIEIYERGADILASWEDIEIVGHRINRGFHGIEMPRAIQFEKILGKKFISENFDRIDNFKLLWINGHEIPYRYKEESIPVEYKDELSEIEIGINNAQEFIENKAHRPNSLGALLKEGSYKYSDKIKDSMHMIYPWFFPEKHFEQSQNLSKQTSHSARSYYLVPKSQTFKSIKHKIKDVLERKDIIIKTNSELDLEKIKESDGLYIWGSNSTGLGRKYMPDKLLELYKSKRNHDLYLFEASKEELNKRFKNYVYTPSEFIVMDRRDISTNRITFRESRLVNDKSLVLVEAISDREEHLMVESVKDIEGIIEDIIQTRAKYIGSKRMMTNYNPSKEIYNQLDIDLQEASERLPVKVYFPYWWPINTTHGANAAERDAKKIVEHSKDMMKGKS